MCSFITTNLFPDTKTLVEANRFSKPRGPDSTNYHFDADTGIYWIHNLLHITGKRTQQPFVIGSDLVYLFNGEVYNYKNFDPTASSDGYCIKDAYVSQQIRDLDGEFAIVINDKRDQKLVILSDAFATKPCWISIESNKFAVCSYRSSNLALGFKTAFKTRPNSRYVLDLGNMSIERFDIYEWNLTQTRNSFDRWCDLFDLSISKRIANTDEKSFVGLSSGYDSGCIVSSLQRNKAIFTTYSVRAGEDLQILEKRHERLPADKKHFMYMTKADYKFHKKYVSKFCEYYESEYYIKGGYYVVQKDKGAIGTSFVCSKAKRDGFKIYMSGHGADEVYSDYGFSGRPIPGFEHCDIAGLFPEDLASAFPWKNFSGYRMIDFAYKDEAVGGSYGLEVRYPFLDRSLVQEFLNIRSDLKNRCYKAPLHHYLKANGYPFSEGAANKVGFRARSNLIGGVWSFGKRR